MGADRFSGGFGSVAGGLSERLTVWRVFLLSTTDNVDTYFWVLEYRLKIDLPEKLICEPYFAPILIEVYQVDMLFRQLLNLFH